jgi:hypothetical protein
MKIYFKHQSGAYDDASGVSVILELIVNLMNRPPLRHSVLFVCTQLRERDLSKEHNKFSERESFNIFCSAFKQRT